MKQTITKILVSGTLAIAMIPSINTTTIHAEDYTDTDAWNTKCQSENIKTTDDYNACKAYTEYIASQTPELQKQLDDINSQKSSIEADIASYQTQLDSYQANLDTLNASIGDLESQKADIQAKIDDTQAQIEQKQADINTAQASIDSMSDKVKERMVNSQKSLRINNMIDILMGAKSLSDFLRIANGLTSITNKENEENQELVSAMDTLQSAKTVLQQSQDELASQQDELKDQEDKIQSQREVALVEQYKVQVIQTAARSQEALLAAQGSHISSNIDNISSTMNSISSSLDAYQEEINNPQPTPTPDSGNGDDPAPTDNPDTPTIDSTGWARPVYGSYRSAGTWEYPGGGIHLGYDFAVPTETPLYAAGNGVILNSVNGCGYGYLGSRCGYEQGGGYGGGNQIYLLCVVNGKLYGLIYCHMTLDSPIPKGTLVKAGDYIGLSGSSGNSSGPHCHIEVMYLGDGSDFADYARNYRGELSYGAGWAGDYDGYGRRCEAGYDAPCRIRPETIWGY